jgi:secreted PhoX family phosphatase
VSNSERDGGAGGVGALRFDATGTVTDAYPLLQGTTDNCAGGATPWGTWLSCEEYAQGHVFECDPTGAKDPVERLALGTFCHEAAAVDPKTQRIYLTEDEPDGRLYRFTPVDALPGGEADLSAGTLEAAGLTGTDPHTTRRVAWYPLTQPNPDLGHPAIPTRYQAPLSTAFEGGEGIFHHQGLIYFTTKRDNRVWVHDIAAETIALVYDGDIAKPALSQVDNVTVDTGGTVFVAEDGPSQRIVAFTPDERAGAILEVVGHVGSELTGPAFDPSGTRLYFSSQRGPDAAGRPWGVTFEVSGPFASL